MRARCVLRLILASSFCLGALPQTGFEKYYLPTAVVLRGDLVDNRGVPLSGVSIHYLEEDGYQRAPLDIGAEGRFDVSTRASAIVFRKPGFESEYVRVAESPNLRITMRKTISLMPACKVESRCIGTNRLCLPELAGFHFMKPDVGFDASVRSITAPRLVHGKEQLTYGIGPSWVGIPRPKQVWTSAEYSETQKRIGDLFMTDARGTSEAGKLWRRLGTDYEVFAGGAQPYHVGESVSYEDVDALTAAVFDRLIENICVKVPEKR